MRKRFTYKKVNGIYHVYDSTKDNKLVKRFKTLTKLATFLMLNGQDSQGYLSGLVRKTSSFKVEDESIINIAVGTTVKASGEIQQNFYEGRIPVLYGREVQGFTFKRLKQGNI